MGLVERIVDASRPGRDIDTWVDTVNKMRNPDGEQVSCEALAGAFLKELGYNENSPLYKAAVAVGNLADQPLKGGQTPAYHNQAHFREVMAGAFRMALAARNENQSNPKKGISQEEAALLIIAAAGHDIEHPGGGNTRPLEFEVQSARKVHSVIKSVGLDLRQKNTVIMMIATTDHAKGVSVMHKRLKGLEGEKRKRVGRQNYLGVLLRSTDVLCAHLNQTRKDSDQRLFEESVEKAVQGGTARAVAEKNFAFMKSDSSTFYNTPNMRKPGERGVPFPGAKPAGFAALYLGLKNRTERSTG